MATVNLVYYHQVSTAIDYYTHSAYYQGERLISAEEFEQSGPGTGSVVILGRSGHYHHYDLRHIELLRDSGRIPDASDTTLVVYDWHEDIDHDPEGETELGNGSWGYVGLVRNLYANMYMLGVNPRGFNELNPSRFDEELRPTKMQMMKLLDRVHLFPAEPSYYCFKFFPEAEHFLENNSSIEHYFTVKEGGFVQVRFKGMEQATYRNRKGGIVISIDLDVLRRSEVTADCPQGVKSVDELLAELRKLQATGGINAFLICGLTESPKLLDEQSLASVARILSQCSQIVSPNG